MPAKLVVSKSKGTSYLKAIHNDLKCLASLRHLSP